jgi:tetratricopeptide (TPR) repeat protein
LSLPVTPKEKLLQSAAKALEKGAVDKAIQDYQKAAEVDPKDTRTWLKVAELQVRRGKNADATATYLKTAELYTDQGFFQRAVAVYKNVLKLSPGLVDAHFKLADLFRQLGLLSDAMQQYEAAAAVYQRDGKVNEALGAMRRIVDLNPDHVMSRIKLAESASQAGKKDEAIAEFKRAADHLKLTGKIDEYLRVGERLFSHQPDNLQLALEMAESYVERNNGRFALAKLQPCFNANPRDVKVLTLLSRAFEQLGQIAKTVSVLKEIAHIHRDQGRENDAVATYRKILALDPSDVEARNEMARVQVTQAAAPTGRQRPAAITFSEMAVPQFLLPREGSQAGVPSVQQIQPSQRAPILPSSAPTLPPQRAPVAPARAPAPVSAAPSASHSEVVRIISECDTFVKYMLLDRAAEHLLKVFDFEPEHLGARERLAEVLLQLGRDPEASTHLAMLAEQTRTTDPTRSKSYAQRAVAAAANTGAVDGGTIPGEDMPFDLPDEEEILDVDDLGGEFIPEPSIAGNQRERMPSAAPKDDWAPPTFAEMALPDFSGFDSSTSTQGDISQEQIMHADLEQVDSFLSAGFIDEARSLLNEVGTRFGGHAAVLERRQRLLGLSGSIPGAGNRSAPPPVSGMPRAVVADGGETDASTHADLGIAYKDMGLFDAALREFEKLSTDSRREVYALMMMGECYESKGSLPEAIVNYKKALNRPGITEAETTQVYYALGKVFEALPDAREALYFFDKVLRRDPNVFDVRDRIDRLRGGAGRV